MKRPSHQWFDEFVEETRHALAAYVRRFCSSREDAQEITQEAYLRVYCALRKNVDRNHEPTALLYTTARNIALSRLRHDEVVVRKNTVVVVAEELRAETRSTEQLAGESQKMQSLLIAVNNLPPKCRAVFSMRMIDGMSQRDIGERLRISESTVEKHISKGMRLCREELRAPAAEIATQVEQLRKRTGT